MPEKIDSYRTYGMKLITLFAKLMFSKESHSLTDLARMLSCSKQTVLRLISDIKRSYGVDIVESFIGRRKYYQLKKATGITPALYLTEDEISVLHMCKAFTEHLLGPELMKEAAQAIEKSQVLLPENQKVSSGHFASYHQGTIDYTDHQNTIKTLIRAMEEQNICKVSYKAILVKRAKIFYINPLKLFSHKDALYLSARMARYPGTLYKEPDFDPLLAVHRIQKVQITERKFKFPSDYHFEKVFDKNFGIIKEDSFDVEVEFDGYAAVYVSERIWSPDQKMTTKRNGKIRLQLSASSEPELISWVLSFGDEAKVMKPDWLVDKIGLSLKRALKNY